ncbi:MAG: flagellar protein FliS [Clostridiales bacterium]|nr:flagellar protein FliS [Clostridiales bacterium]
MVKRVDKEKLNAYAARVSQANRSELVVIIFEAFIDSVKEGDARMREGDMPACRLEMERARGFLTELMGSLDFQYEISYYLRRLYVYAYHEICQGMALRDSERFSHANQVMEALLPAFRQVAEQDNSETVMKNVQQIYAGLTYGRGSLHETIGVDIGKERGFEA